MAYSGSAGIIKDQTAIVCRKMDAGNTCRFSIGHARYGRRDGWSYATGSALFAAFHKKREWINHSQVTKIPGTSIIYACVDRNLVNSF
jgi:hypothetical protein